MSVSIVALVEFVRESLGDPVESETVVVVDGGVYEKFETLGRQIQTRTQELLRGIHSPDIPRVIIKSAKGGSCFGAAVLAAATCCDQYHR